MLTFSLQSGSNGNSIYVEAGGVRLLFDVGISGALAAERMAARGRDLAEVDAIILSHEHDDHVRGAGVLNRRFGTPIYLTRGTMRGAADLLGDVRSVHYFSGGERIEFGAVRVWTVKTPHDAADPVCFVVEHEGRRLGIMTDLGHPFRVLPGVLGDVHAAYLESNYDPELLEIGPYTPELKSRIRGPRGHISNDEAAELSAGAARNLKWLAAAHLSEVNNDPSLALGALQRAVGKDLPVMVASRYAVGEMLEV